MRPVQGWTALWASVERRWRATEIVAQGRVATSATKPRPHVFKFDAPQTVTTGGQVREIQPLADLDFNVKVADFGCSKQGLDMSTSFHGTRIDRVLLLDDAPRLKFLARTKCCWPQSHGQPKAGPGAVLRSPW
eukprot:s2049_g10.t1